MEAAAVCGRCYATVTHASPRYAEPRNMMTPVKVQMVRLPDPPRVEDEKVLCPGSDLACSVVRLQAARCLIPFGHEYSRVMPTPTALRQRAGCAVRCPER